MSVSAVFVGSGKLLASCVNQFVAAGHVVTAVATRDQWIVNWCRQHGHRCLSLDSVLQDNLAGLAFQYLFSIANLEMLPQGMIERPQRLALNFHDGPLPAYAGLNATTWAIANGESRHAITWHEMTAKPDDGRIALQAEIEIDPSDTAFSLNTKCFEAGERSFGELLRRIETDALTLTPQQGTRSYYGRAARAPAAGLIDPRRSGEEIAAMVRALDMGPFANSVGTASLRLPGRTVLVTDAELVDEQSDANLTPGTVLAADNEAITISTATAPVRLWGLRSREGAALQDKSTPIVPAGTALPLPDAELLSRLDAFLRPVAAAERHWIRAFSVPAIDLPYPRRGAPGTSDGLPRHSVVLRGAMRGDFATFDVDTVIAAFSAWLCNIAGAAAVTLDISDRETRSAVAGLEDWYLAWKPLLIEIEGNATPDTLTRHVHEGRQANASRGPVTADLMFRQSGPGRPIATQRQPAAAIWIGPIDVAASASFSSDIALLLDPDAQELWLTADAQSFELGVVETLAAHLNFFLRYFSARPEHRLVDLPLIPDDEASQVKTINRAAVRTTASETIADALAAQARLTPDTCALRFGSQSVSYAELARRSDAMASRLAALGARPGVVIGVCVERTIDLIIALHGILKAGAAYLPLDPAYPQERLGFMIEDSGATAVVATKSTASLVRRDGVRIIPADATEKDGDATTANVIPPSSEDLAYLIYTSGSTGKPKGVMVSHANVANFFAGMDERIPKSENPTWLAVTSPSFDISVLELIWTFCRGYTVALHSDLEPAASEPTTSFSLLYFAASTGSVDGADAYRLLLEGAKFADASGFEAIWVPERHFHAFGGLFPNPAVAAAAVASVTHKIQIRAGSVVLPLHQPSRVAEEWSVVDNISNGRTGIAFASGWNPQDFVLAPERYDARKKVLIDGIDTVRRLWRGETLTMAGPSGQSYQVATYPRPVQSELPVWLTSARSIETFEIAGRKGWNVLTHLLGMSLDELSLKIAAYRRAWQDAGHPGQGRMTLMLHTFVGDDDDAVREIVRAPLKSYLSTSVDLVRDMAASFPTAANQKQVAELETLDGDDLSSEEVDALLDYAFDRYFETSGLFGSQARCLDMVRRVQSCGVDEIACLIDFGIETDAVLASLPKLAAVMNQSRGIEPRRHPPSVAENIVKYGATHLQCTPSLAAMLTADSEGRAAVRRLETLLVGGEALPQKLADDLVDLTRGRLHNMYGPTETTIWSSTAHLSRAGETVPLGTPIANTTLHVVLPDGRECPALVPGELLIGGAGVTKGYWQRPDLTAEKFIERPSSAGGIERLYRTGDFVRRKADGRLEFLGRIDGQVKIRGHRIETGEIESALLAIPGVEQAAVTADTCPLGETRLRAFVTSSNAAAVSNDALLRRLRETLPAIMVPETVAVMDAFPMTPNGKIDRKALRPVVIPPANDAATGSPVEIKLRALWCDVLGVETVGTGQNFFDLGGHSLLAVQLQRRISATFGTELPLTDIFRYPTVRALAERIGGTSDTRAAIARGADRAKSRLSARRRGIGEIQQRPLVVSQSKGSA